MAFSFLELEKAGASSATWKAAVDISGFGAVPVAEYDKLPSGSLKTLLTTPLPESLWNASAFDRNAWFMERFAEAGFRFCISTSGQLGSLQNISMFSDDLTHLVGIYVTGAADSPFIFTLTTAYSASE